jgi:hypothetical protein
MTQRLLKTVIDGRVAFVQMGWDARLQYHYMVIDHEDSDQDEPLYSNLNDRQAGLGGSLDYFVEQARLLGVDIPPAMIARLLADEALNIGNATSEFDAAGAEMAG